MIAQVMRALALFLILCASARAGNRPILVVITAADQLTLKDGTAHPTGFYANEFQEPYEAFAKMGYAIAVASPGGKPPTVDPRSLESKHFNNSQAEADHVKQWLADLPALKAPLDLARVHATDYAGIFVPGGHGPMQDLASSPDMARVLREAIAAKRPIGLLCHGPGALLSLRGKEPWPFKGYNLTAFSNDEEGPELGAKMRETPETALKALGANYSKADAKYAPHIVSDRELVTGQNPASAKPVATAFLHALGAFHINGPNLPDAR